MNVYQQRVLQVQVALQQADIDYVFLSISPDLFYLSGYTSFVSERLHLLIVPAHGRPTLVFPDFEKEMVSHLAGWVDIIGWQEAEDPVSVVRQALPPRHRQGPVRIAIGDHMQARFSLPIEAALPGSRLSLASELLAPLRRVKDSTELELLRKAQELAVQALQRLLEEPLAGHTERRIAARLQHFCQEVGFEQVEGVLVGSGPNGASPHLAPTDRVIQRGEPVVIDFGCVHQGYYSDCTRTVHVGPPSTEFVQIFEIVRDANHAALAAVRPGVPCQEIDRTARRAIEGAGYGPFFTHRVGHGIGIEVHEEPWMVEGNQLPLEPGMTFTDEPGIYIPGRFGCRLEDVVTVTPEGGVALTPMTHDLIIVD